MQNDQQNKPTAIVWSKNSCMQCSEAKYLLKKHGIAYEERNVDQGKFSREDFVQANPNAKTFPQIWIDGVLIGGFTDLRNKLK